MRNVKKSPVVILFIVAAVLYVIIYILPQVTGVLRSSYTAEYGELKTFDKVEGYFVRSEYVYFSDLTGTANRYIDENKLVRKGTRIMEVKAGSAASDDEAGAGDTEAEASEKDQKKAGSGGAEGKDKASGKEQASSGDDAGAEQTEETEDTANTTEEEPPQGD